MALIFDVKVIPGSGRQEWRLDKSGNLKCYLKSQAEQGKANVELIKKIAKNIGMPESMIAIVLGQQSRKKRIKIEVDITYNKLLQLFGIEQQMNVFRK